VDSDDQEFYQNFRSVAGAVLLVFNPLSMRSLSNLLVTLVHPPKSLTLYPPSTLFSLSQISAEDPIQTFHKSFPDFLMDPGRCKDKRFFVDPPVHHRRILFSCLDLMRERLRRNICNLDDYTVLSEVKDLPTHLKTHIGDALGYACQFWTSHLVEFLVAAMMLRKCTRQLIGSLKPVCSLGLRSSASLGTSILVFMPSMMYSNGICW
jgi:hypothetical protein